MHVDDNRGEDVLELSTVNLAPSRDRLEGSRRLLELLGVTAEDRALEHAGPADGAWPNPYADGEGEEAWLNRIIDVDWASLDDELERCENLDQLRLFHNQAVEPLTRLLSGQRLGQEQETEVLRQRLNSGPNCPFKNGFYNGIPSMVVNDHPLGRVGGGAADDA